jgi:hypothetical protein
VVAVAIELRMGRERRAVVAQGATVHEGGITQAGAWLRDGNRVDELGKRMQAEGRCEEITRASLVATRLSRQSHGQ